QISNNRNMFLTVPRARSGAAGGLQGTARLTGQTLGAVVVSALLSVLPLELAPRIGLGVAAVLTFVAGLVSTLRATTESDAPAHPPRSVPQGLRQLLLDLLSALTFVLLFALTGKLLVASAGAIAIAVVQTGLAIVRKEAVSSMHWLALGLAVGLGVLTLITDDSRFVQVKPSIAHAAVGAVMLKPGWLIPYLPPRAREWLPRGVLVGWGYAWAVSMFAMAAANLVAAQYLSVKAWGVFVTGLFVGKLVLFGVQYVVLRTTVVRKIRAASLLGLRR
ncbi:MAG TPA: septation protein IspZ, partial [Polyangiales bacterium]|nr:septation protein IspZ [Polyangiales bacterium]